MKTYNPNLSVPEEISRKAMDLKTWMEMFNAESIWGMGNVTDLQRQLADAIRERDQYKAACELADALRPLGTVQVVEGGGAVLLDTSKALWVGSPPCAHFAKPEKK